MKHTIHFHRGVTLIELMISMVIALVLAGAVIVTYSSTKLSYLLLSNVSNVQETGRFAIHRMSEDLRLSGYWGINSWAEAIDQGDTASINLGCGSAVGWVTDLETPLIVLDAPTASDLPSCIASANHLAGTDIIFNRHVSRQLDSATNIVKGNVYLHAGIFKGALFKADETAEVDSAVDFNEAPVMLVYPFEMYIYYIRPCSDMGVNNVCDANDDNGDLIPTLVRHSLNGTTMRPEPIAQYVENMQIVLGEDTDGDGTVDRLRKAGDVSNWDNVHSVEVSLLVRADSAEAGYQENIDGAKDSLNSNKRGSYTFGGQTILKTDGYRRQLFVSTINVRNDPSENDY